MNAEELQESIKALRDLTPTLNTATDEATSVVASVEAFLRECGVGFPVDVCVNSEPATDVEEDELPEGSKGSGVDDVMFLFYARMKGGDFRIGIRIDRRYYLDAEESRCTERCIWQGYWPAASRVMKLKAFPFLPKLLHELAATTAETIEGAKATTKTVREILTALGQE